MPVHTVQMAQWRKAKAKDIRVVDITLKSGERHFAPSPKLLSLYKCGHIDPEGYTERFVQEMRESYRKAPQLWIDLALDDNYALACYCRAGDFCHRHLVVELLEKVAASQGHQLIRGEEITA